MNTKSKVISLLLFVLVLIIFSGCGGRAVPTEDETKSAIESHVRTFANSSPALIISQVKVEGINSFKLLEVYDHNYDFSQLAEKIKGKEDLNYLNSTKDMYKGDWAIVKASYTLRYSSNTSSTPPDDGSKSQWFLMQKPEEGSWSVGMPLTEPARD